MDVPRHELDADFIAEIAIGTVLLAGGCVGNALTVHFIRKNHELHAPTFVLIACLACTDISALISRYLFLTFDLVLSYAPDGIINFVVVFGLAALHSSNMHIVILAHLRYKLIVYPLHTVDVRLRTIYRNSAIAWIVSILVALCLELPMIIGVDDQVAYIITVCNGFYLLLSTLIPILWFHFYKVKALRSSTAIPSGGHDVTGMMSVMVTLILTSQVVAIVPLVTASVTMSFIDDIHLRNVLGNTAHCFLLLNHSINPVLFFYFSKFRRRNIDEV
ncbi:hypothetical protein FSP39_014393 [Pinctada imbricata]|uniref:G-protein coupled receptors family 1 profile domain-containing protein n=1 Tax=Pinctada imbricata TaxID=66713 RepID=A0AA89BTZ5_PINIB|nr:hypothetical protein FSP39_014393 [Pinctada imbricata]